MDNYFKTNNSDTKFVGIINHKINMYKYVPLKGKSYITLPKSFANNNKGLCNIKNDDEKCFMWCHIAFCTQLKVINIDYQIMLIMKKMLIIQVLHFQLL